jgi:hypothetical protein
MKKILFTLIIVVCSISLFGQTANFDTPRVIVKDTLRVLSVFELDSNMFNSTTQESVEDTILASKDYVDGKAAGLDSIMDIDSEYWAKIYLNGAVVDSFQVDSTYHSVYSDTTTYAENGVDSLSYDSEYYIKTYLNSVAQDSALVDSVHHAVKSDTATVALNIAEKSVYQITLPGAGSVSTRVASAISVPDGWSLTGDGLDLIITHNMDRWGAGTKIQENTSGTIWQELRNTPSDNGFANLSSNQCKIYSLATVAKPIKIYITFE